MRLRKIAKSKMSAISEKHGNPIVAHLAPAGTCEPLCKAKLPQRAHWVDEWDREWAAVRDCRNCTKLARRTSDPAGVHVVTPSGSLRWSP